MQVPRQGFRTPFKGGTVLDIAKSVLEIAKGGLERRGFAEASFLNELENIVESGRCPAEILLDKYAKEWHYSVDPVFTEFQY